MKVKTRSGKIISARGFKTSAGLFMRYEFGCPACGYENCDGCDNQEIVLVLDDCYYLQAQLPGEIIEDDAIYLPSAQIEINESGKAF